MDLPEMDRKAVVGMAINYFILICAVLGAAISSAIYYSLVLYYDRSGALKLKKKGIFIQDIRVILFAVVLLVTMSWVGYKFLLDRSDVIRFFPYLYAVGMAFLSTTDMIEHRVPNKMLAIMLLCWMGLVGMEMFINIYRAMETVFFHGISGLIAVVIFLITYFISHRKLGLGDVKLSFIMGLYLGNNMIIAAIFYGTVLCCIYSIVQVARKKLSMKDGVPMVPFLFFGSLIVMSIF